MAQAAAHTCPICGKPVKLASQFGRSPKWIHTRRFDDPSPWHNPTPADAERAR